METVLKLALFLPVPFFGMFHGVVELVAMSLASKCVEPEEYGKGTVSRVTGGDAMENCHLFSIRFQGVCHL